MTANNKQTPTPVLVWRNYILKVTDQFPELPIISKIGDSTIATLGNISASSGKEKSKKTFNVSAIVASLLSGRTVLNYIPVIPTKRKKILYIDTEQSPYHCKKVLARIISLAGLEPNIHPENLIFVQLRKFSPKERISLVEQAIYDIPDLFFVVIDGIRDLAYDINSSTEAMSVLSNLMKWSEERNIHIHNVLHLNKGDDNTRGHLGTELNNKAETILQMTKSDIDSNVSIVRAKCIRDIEFEPFAFQINNDGLPELTDNATSNTRVKSFDYNELSEDEHREALNKTFEDNKQLGYGLLVEKLQECYREVTGVEFGVAKAKSLKVFLVNKRMIVQNGKKYELNKNFYY